MPVYNLQPISIEDKTAKRSIERELNTVADVVNGLNEKTAERISHAAPAGSERVGNPLFGYEVYADGTDWNPDGSGAGWFKRGPTTWERMTTG